MSDEAIKPPNPEDAKPAETIVLEIREVHMYKDYLRHMTIDEISKKYGISLARVYEIAKTNGWKKKRKHAIQLAYRSLDKIYQEQIVSIVAFINKDVKMLMKRCMSENREMNKEERQYVLSLFEKIVKESRLTEGTPTEITDGTQTVRHVVELPAGVKRFGVLPPAKNVTQIETIPVVKSTKEDKSKDEDFDDDL